MLQAHLCAGRRSPWWPLIFYMNAMILLYSPPTPYSLFKSLHPPSPPMKYQKMASQRLAASSTGYFTTDPVTKLQIARHLASKWHFGDLLLWSECCCGSMSYEAVHLSVWIFDFSFSPGSFSQIAHGFLVAQVWNVSHLWDTDDSEGHGFGSSSDKTTNCTSMF